MALNHLIPFSRQRRQERGNLVRRGGDNSFMRLQEEMNRLFDNFLDSPFQGGMELASDDALGFTPVVDVKETKKDIRVTAELPGVDEKDLDVRLDGNALTLRGEKREEKTEKDGDWTHSECCYGSFIRTIPFAVEIDANRVEASFKKGVLKVTLPKAKPEAPDKGRIEVKAG